MRALLTTACLAVFLMAPAIVVRADDDADKYTDTIKLFQNAGDSAGYFKSSHGYAVFPNIGKAGLGIGGAHGQGRVFVAGKAVGKTKMTQLSIGWQAGAQGFSMIVFFEDKRSFEEFTSGNFEFGANASAVAITAAAGAAAGTTGTGAGASAGKKDAATVGQYYKGMATFTIVKGGLMYEAAVAGAKFSFEPL